MKNITVYGCKLVREKELPYGKVTTAEEAATLFHNLGLHDETEECAAIACFDCKGKTIGVHEVARGALTGCYISPASVFRRALLNNAASIILAHNHPSGDPTPSKDDIELTETLRKAGELIGIKVMDHIILGDGAYKSFKELGYID